MAAIFIKKIINSLEGYGKDEIPEYQDRYRPQRRHRPPSPFEVLVSRDEVELQPQFSKPNSSTSTDIPITTPVIVSCNTGYDSTLTESETYNINDIEANLSQGFISSGEQSVEISDRNQFVLSSSANLSGSPTVFSPVFHCTERASQELQIAAESEVHASPPDPYITDDFSFKGKQIERLPPLTNEEFLNFFDPDGRLVNEHSFKKCIFKGGVRPEIRRDVWRFLFGLYPSKTTARERDIIKARNHIQYKALKTRWHCEFMKLQQQDPRSVKLCPDWYTGCSKRQHIAETITIPSDNDLYESFLGGKADHIDSTESNSRVFCDPLSQTLEVTDVSNMLKDQLKLDDCSESSLCKTKLLNTDDSLASVSYVKETKKEYRNINEDAVYCQSESFEALYDQLNSFRSLENDESFNTTNAPDEVTDALWDAMLEDDGVVSYNDALLTSEIIPISEEKSCHTSSDAGHNMVISRSADKRMQKISETFSEWEVYQPDIIEQLASGDSSDAVLVSSRKDLYSELTLDTSGRDLLETGIDQESAAAEGQSFFNEDTNLSPDIDEQQASKGLIGTVILNSEMDVYSEINSREINDSKIICVDFSEKSPSSQNESIAHSDDSSQSDNQKKVLLNKQLYEDIEVEFLSNKDSVYTKSDSINQYEIYFDDESSMFVEKCDSTALDSVDQYQELCSENTSMSLPEKDNYFCVASDANQYEIQNRHELSSSFEEGNFPFCGVSDSVNQNICYDKDPSAQYLKENDSSRDVSDCIDQNVLHFDMSDSVKQTICYDKDPSARYIEENDLSYNVSDCIDQNVLQFDEDSSMLFAEGDNESCGVSGSMNHCELLHSEDLGTAFAGSDDDSCSVSDSTKQNIFCFNENPSTVIVKADNSLCVVETNSDLNKDVICEGLTDALEVTCTETNKNELLSTMVESCLVQDSNDSTPFPSNATEDVSFSGQCSSVGSSLKQNIPLSLPLNEKPIKPSRKHTDKLYTDGKDERIDNYFVDGGKHIDHNQNIQTPDDYCKLKVNPEMNSETTMLNSIHSTKNLTQDTQHIRSHSVISSEHQCLSQNEQAFDMPKDSPSDLQNDSSFEISKPKYDKTTLNLTSVPHWIAQIVHASSPAGAKSSKHGISYVSKEPTMGSLVNLDKFDTKNPVRTVSNSACDFDDSQQASKFINNNKSEQKRTINSNVNNADNNMINEETDREFSEELARILSSRGIEGLSAALELHANLRRPDLKKQKLAASTQSKEVTNNNIISQLLWTSLTNSSSEGDTWGRQMIQFSSQPTSPQFDFGSPVLHASGEKNNRPCPYYEKQNDGFVSVSHSFGCDLLKSLELEAQLVAARQRFCASAVQNSVRIIDKDIPRTDRDLDFYSGDGNRHLLMLRDALITYAFYHPEVGYAQGMNDIMSQFLLVLNSEADAYWMFCCYMDHFKANFMEEGMLKKISMVDQLLMKMDRQLYDFLQEREMDLMFCHRWLLLSFKREFKHEDAFVMFEVISSHYLEVFSLEAEMERYKERAKELERNEGNRTEEIDSTPNYSFDVFVCVTLLHEYRELIMQNKDFVDIYRAVLSLPQGLDVNAILSKAEELFYRFCRKSITDSFQVIHKDEVSDKDRDFGRSKKK